MTKIIDVNVATGEIVERNATAEEVNQFKIDAENHAAEKANKAEATNKRQTLLDKLGITEEEAKLLLGGN